MPEQAWTPVPTFFSGEELTCLYNHAKEIRANDVLEIGTYCGAATAELLAGSTGLVFSVDPLTHASIPLGIQESWIHCLLGQYPARLIFIPAPSHTLIWRRKVSIVMIDGDHAPMAVARDIRMFAPMVQDGGSLILDDMHDEGVRTAWNYHLKTDRATTWTKLRDGKLQIWRKGK